MSQLGALRLKVQGDHQVSESDTGAMEPQFSKVIFRYEALSRGSHRARRSGEDTRAFSRPLAFPLPGIPNSIYTRHFYYFLLEYKLQDSISNFHDNFTLYFLPDFIHGGFEINLELSLRILPTSFASISLTSSVLTTSISFLLQLLIEHQTLEFLSYAFYSIHDSFARTQSSNISWVHIIKLKFSVVCQYQKYSHLS